MNLFSTHHQRLILLLIRRDAIAQAAAELVNGHAIEQNWHASLSENEQAQLIQVDGMTRAFANEVTARHGGGIG